MAWGRLRIIIGARIAALRRRKSSRVPREPHHQQASTSQGRKLNAIPLVKMAKLAASPKQSVFSQSGLLFHARRSVTVQTIQNETTAVFFTPEDSRARQWAELTEFATRRFLSSLAKSLATGLMSMACGFTGSSTSSSCSLTNADQPILRSGKRS